MEVTSDEHGGSWVKSTRSGEAGCVEVWKKSTFSLDTACVEVSDRRRVRDSKLGNASPVLEFNEEEWQAFIAGVKRGEFD